MNYFYNKKHERYVKFTLIELLAAMFVFSIMLTLSIQLFSSARNLWARSEQRSNFTTDLRMTMDFIAQRIQSVSYQEEIPFCIQSNGIFFASNFYINERKSKKGDHPKKGDPPKKDNYQTRFYYVGLVDNDGKPDSSGNELAIKIYSDSMSHTLQDFQNLLPPFASVDDATLAQTTVKNELSNIPKSNEFNYATLLNNVAEFKIDNPDNPETALPTFGPPSSKIRIKVTVMDSADSLNTYKEKTGVEQSNVKATHGYSYERIIILPDFTPRD